MSYRNDLDALEARHTALGAELATKTKELEAATRILEEAKARAKLPILDNIGIASPCRVDWNTMTGDERVRLCSQCDKNVYNLSGMTRDEAQALIVEKNGKLCVSYFQRGDGTILLADCTIGKAAARRRKWIAAGAVALLAGGGAAARHAMHHDPDPRMDDITVTPGDEAITEHVTGNMRVPAPPPAPPPVVVPVELEQKWHRTAGVMVLNHLDDLK